MQVEGGSVGDVTDLGAVVQREGEVRARIAAADAANGQGRRRFGARAVCQGAPLTLTSPRSDGSRWWFW